MRIAISQPEHFPYLGFFQKMCACDVFVLLDDVQFSGPRSFQNRNRYHNSNGEFLWFTVPVKKGSYYQKINEVMVSENPLWRIKLKKKLYQDLRFSDFEEIYDFERLIDINIASINYCRKAFMINVPMIRSSTLNVDGHKAQRIYNICKKLGATTYVAGLGSKDYMLSTNFPKIEIQYFYPEIDNYESSLIYALNRTEEMIKTFRKISAFPNVFCKGN